MDTPAEPTEKIPPEETEAIEQFGAALRMALEGGESWPLFYEVTKRRIGYSINMGADQQPSHIQRFMSILDSTLKAYDAWNTELSLHFDGELIDKRKLSDEQERGCEDSVLRKLFHAKRNAILSLKRELHRFLVEDARRARRH